MIPPPMPKTAEIEEVMNAASINMRVSTIENLGLKLNYMCKEINCIQTKSPLISQRAFKVKPRNKGLNPYSFIIKIDYLGFTFVAHGPLSLDPAT
jgi:hypothetical protein